MERNPSDPIIRDAELVVDRLRVLGDESEDRSRTINLELGWALSKAVRSVLKRFDIDGISLSFKYSIDGTSNTNSSPHTDLVEDGGTIQVDDYPFRKRIMLGSELPKPHGFDIEGHDWDGRS